MVAPSSLGLSPQNFTSTLIPHELYHLLPILSVLPCDVKADVQPVDIQTGQAEVKSRLP